MTQEALRRVESTDRQRSEHPLATYHVILGATLLLLVLGIAMVLSASTVESYRVFGSAYTLWLRQLMFAALGLVLMVIASRLPVRVWRRLAYPTLVFAFVTLMLVLVVGPSVAGQRNWVELGGPFRFQPCGVLTCWPASRGCSTSGSICSCRSCRWPRACSGSSFSRATWAPH